MRAATLTALFLSVLPACASTKPAAPESGRVRAKDGVEIAYDVQGSGEPTLLLIHCWCGNREFWREQMPELVKDHRVVRLDLPGHGASGRGRANWSVTGLGDDVQAVANHLHLEHMILVGHSMGGPVALSAAARMPGRVVGIIGLDNLHDADNPMTHAMVDPLAANLEADFETAIGTAIHQMVPKDVDPAVPNWIIDQAVRTDPRAAAALMRNFGDLDVPALFRNAHAPIRCINSAGSPWPTNVAANRKYADFDALIMQGVGHFGQLEKPAEFNVLLRATLDRLEQRPAR